MRLEIVAHLPEGSRVLLEMPMAMYKVMSERGPAEIDNKRKIALLPANPHGLRSLGNMVFKAKSKAKLSLLVHIPKEYRKMPYDVSVRQTCKEQDQEQEMGRVTWRLVPPRKKKPVRQSKRRRKS